MHPIPLQDCIVGNGLGDVAFARPWAPDQKGVLSSGDKLQGMKLEAGFFRDLWIVAPVKLVKCELFIQSRQRVAALDLS